MRVRLLLSFLALIPLLPSPSAARSFDSSDPARKFSSSLRMVVEQPASRIGRESAGSGLSHLRTNDAGDVHVYVRLSDLSHWALAAIESLGLDIDNTEGRNLTVTGWIAPGDLAGLASSDYVASVRPVIPPATNVGSVTSEGDAILRADVVRGIGYDGTGVKVGVVSDDVDNLASAQASGDLPPVTVLGTTAAVGDEGTAMLEIIHDIAPGAELYFYTGWNSSLDMADGIRALAAAGCDVIVDDITWFGEPYFEDGLLAQVADSVVDAGVFYCSSAGNAAQEHYEHLFTPANGASRLHAWDASGDSTLAVDVDPGGFLRVFMQWDDPFGGSANDYDLGLFADEALTDLVSVSDAEQSGTQDPFEAVYYENSSQSVVTLYLAIEKFAGTARVVELFVDGASWREWIVPTGSVFGHSAAQNVVSVASINADDVGTDDIASYSSHGPSEISYPSAQTRLKPNLTAIDGVTVTGAGGFHTPFYGTSAAAPHVAGIAALVLDAHPEWSPQQVRQSMQTTAVDIGPAGLDYTSGYGRVRADQAVGVAFAGPTSVRGTILTQTWTKENSPYRVESLILVPEGETLTIEPGVDVLFDYDCQFIVRGAIVAEGTQQDSIRFLRGVSSSWGGLRLTGTAPSSLRFVRISNGYAQEPVDNGNRGGGLYVNGTPLSISDAVISGNTALGPGGGIYWLLGADADIVRVQLLDNNAGGSDACTIWGEAYDVTLTDCEFYGYQAGVEIDARNVVVQDCFIGSVTTSGFSYYLKSVGGAVVLDRTLLGYGTTYVYGPDLFVSHCTVQWSFLSYASNSEAVNSIFMSSAPTAGTVRYCLLQSTGHEGSFWADPGFVNPASSDFRLLWNSPCIDMGDPSSPLDPDGTRADIGLFYYDQSGLADEIKLPAISALPGEVISIPVRATLGGIQAVDLAFSYDASVLEPLSPLVISHAFEALPDAQSESHVEGNAVRVAVSASAPIDLANDELVRLSFRVSAEATPGTVGQLVWLGFPETNVEERATRHVNGAITVLQPPVVFGDVTNDGSVTAFDASLILRYVVHLGGDIDVQIADVTYDGLISSFDAALVLKKVVEPTYLFPVEGGQLPKQAISTPRRLVWTRDKDDWALMLDDPSGVLGVDFRLVGGASVGIEPQRTALAEWNCDGDDLLVAIVLSDGASELLRIGGAGTGRPPNVEDVMLNEGWIPFGGVVVPPSFELSNATPNPFNPATAISFAVPRDELATLSIHDVSGRLVRTLIDGNLTAGRYTVVWDGLDESGRAAASGVYIVRVSTKENAAAQRVTLLR